MDGVRIRLADVNDAELVHKLSARAYIPSYMAVIGAVPRPAFEDYTSQIESGDVWIAEMQNQPAGIIVAEDAPNHLLIYSIAVEPSQQGKGLARVLLSHAEQVALLRGKKELRLYTNERMQQNVQIYLACGFSILGRRSHPSRQGEFLVDMMKSINSRPSA